MKGYASVDIKTNVIQSVFAWKEGEINENYQVDQNSYLLELEENIFRQISSRFPIVSSLKIKDKTATAYENLIEEMTERDFARESEIMQLKNYLASTDFYFIRQLDSGKPIPQDVKDKRDKVRQRLLELGQ